MKTSNLATVIQEAITRASRNRIGAKPQVFVTLAPLLPQVPWQNQKAEDFVRRSVYETLLTSDAAPALRESTPCFTRG